MNWKIFTTSCADVAAMVTARLIYPTFAHLAHWSRLNLGVALTAQGFPDCKKVPYHCSPNTTDDIIYAFLITSLFVYFIGTGFYLRRSFVYLRTKPYNQMRMANQHLRINVRTVTRDRDLNRDSIIPCGLSLNKPTSICEYELRCTSAVCTRCRPTCSSHLGHDHLLP
jgi:hypothetical protein